MNKYYKTETVKKILEEAFEKSKNFNKIISEALDVTITDIDSRIATFNFTFDNHKTYFDIRYDKDYNLHINSNISPSLEELYYAKREDMKKELGWDDIHILSCLLSVFFEVKKCTDITVNIIGD